ncbi:Helix-turn-helix domain-containing protein [Streptomyces sp. yr375]|uniref:helix-turn-helix domain-containing protein n=1 Tax=Streptomyces sp. yr375 TaxID=1761906 RepID=UPI0008C1D981|nr:helix-turn-helix transcriptional regulator [Streptomyces sp. yr375]SES21107.1 Helix-turn-helix domain-containing protein [Streptomyces sp. yr375]
MAEQVDAQGDSGRAVLADTLKFLRERAGKSLGQLADETGYDKSYLSRLESGERLSKVTVMEDLDTYYGAGELLVRHWRVARLDAFRNQYKRFMGLEETARTIWKFSLGVPGILQTEDFARWVLSWFLTTPEKDDDLVEERVAGRLGRQYLLRRNPRPVVRFLVDEVAFRRPVPDPKVWEEQLRHIEDVATWPNVTFQVVPFSAGTHHLMQGTLSMLWQQDGSCVAYSEGNTRGELFEAPEDIELRRLAYDRLRDLALSPSDSLAFLRNVLEEHRS